MGKRAQRVSFGWVWCTRCEAAGPWPASYGLYTPALVLTPPAPDEEGTERATGRPVALSSSLPYSWYSRSHWSALQMTLNVLPCARRRATEAGRGRTRVKRRGQFLGVFTWRANRTGPLLARPVHTIQASHMPAVWLLTVPVGDSKTPTCLRRSVVYSLLMSWA